MWCTVLLKDFLLLSNRTNYKKLRSTFQCLSKLRNMYQFKMKAYWHPFKSLYVAFYTTNFLLISKFRCRKQEARLQDTETCCHRDCVKVLKVNFRNHVLVCFQCNLEYITLFRLCQEEKHWLKIKESQCFLHYINQKCTTAQWNNVNCEKFNPNLSRMHCKNPSWDLFCL